MAETHTPPNSYILRELRDVSVPESVSWLPQTVGWKVLAVLALIGLVYACYRWAHYWWDNRYRKEAVRAITQLDLAESNMLNDLFSILKIVLIHLNHRHANLFNNDFLTKLDELTDNPTNYNDELAQRWLSSLTNPSVKIELQARSELKQRAIKWVLEHKENPQTVIRRQFSHKVKLTAGVQDE